MGNLRQRSKHQWYSMTNCFYVKKCSAEQIWLPSSMHVCEYWLHVFSHGSQRPISPGSLSRKMWAMLAFSLHWMPLAGDVNPAFFLSVSKVTTDDSLVDALLSNSPHRTVRNVGLESNTSDCCVMGVFVSSLQSCISPHVCFQLEKETVLTWACNDYDFSFIQK